MRDLIDEFFSKYKVNNEDFTEKLIEMPKSSYNLPKSKLFIKLVTNTTRFQRNVLKNNLLNYVNDDSLIAFDGKSFVEDINESMKMLDLFNAMISIICFTLGLF
jgi:hypothetical protein